LRNCARDSAACRGKDALDASHSLSFDPFERITCNAALEHPYLAVWHDPADEPVCPTEFDFRCERSPVLRKLQ
jgi:mitogen-activated protein kinase 7